MGFVSRSLSTRSSNSSSNGISSRSSTTPSSSSPPGAATKNPSSSTTTSTTVDAKIVARSGPDSSSFDERRLEVLRSQKERFRLTTTTTARSTSQETSDLTSSSLQFEESSDSLHHSFVTPTPPTADGGGDHAAATALSTPATTTIPTPGLTRAGSKSIVSMKHQLSVRHIGIQAKSATIPTRRNIKDLFALQFPTELHGRAKEQAVLRQIYHHQYQHQHPPTRSTATTSDDSAPRRRPWVSIAGPSGTGKTRLATRLAEEHSLYAEPQQQQRQEQREGALIDDNNTNSGMSSSSSSLFILGKFDFRRRNEPFVAFVHAFEQICARLLSSLDGGDGGDVIATPRSSTVMDEETITKISEDDGNNNDSNDVNSSDHGSGMRTSLSLSSTATATATTSQAARWRSLRERLRQELGEERQVLLLLIPSFSKVLQVDDDEVNDKEEVKEDHTREDHSSTHGLDLQGEEIRNRFIFAVRRCIDIICCTFAPFVLVLDDLQWADAASLGLIKSLLTITLSSSSSSLENLMLIGCYRSNEVHEGHILMTELLDQFDSMGVPHVHIDVDNLSIDTLGGYIAAVLSMEPSECRALTTVVHRKTMGNIFFVKQFLLSLFDDGLLRYNMGSTKWSWSNEAELDAETAATENVVDLMQRRLINLPDPVSRMLQFLACLGSEFDMTLLQLAMEFLHRNDATVLAHTVDFAKICIDNGLIESVGTRFRFVHDRVQESAIDMLPDSDRLDLFFEFGQILSERDDLEERLFTTVDLLNQGVARDAQADSTQLVAIAKLNLRAGKRAMGSAAFGAAASYLEKGIALLPADDLAIEPMFRRELYIAAAEAEFSEGHNDRARELCYDLLGEQDLDKDHRVRAQLVLVDTYTSEFNHAEATSLCLKFLNEQGCVVKRPRDVFLIPAFLSSLAKTKSLMKGMTNDDFLHSPRVADPGKLAVMKLLDRLVSAVYFSDPAFLGLPILLLMRWTVKHGVCAQSCAALATYAYILAGPLGDLKAGFQFATLALDLVDRLDVREVKSKTILLAHAFVIHRYQPVHLSLRTLELGYKDGMSLGKMEHAYNCICAMISHAAMSGKPLKHIEDDLKVYCNQALEFHQVSTRLFMVIRWQLVLNLMGGQENTYALTGKVMTEKEYLDRIAADGNVQLKAGLDRFRNMAAYYFGEYELAATIISGSTDPQDDCFASDLFWDLFFRGLVWAAMARKTNRREHRRKANHFAKRLRKLVKGGCPNCEHQLLTLEAEIGFATKEYKVAAAKYEEAIVMAGRRGFLQDHALSNELYGQFLCSRGETAKGALHINKAISLYQEWGAHAKVDHVRARFSTALEDTEVSAASVFG